MSKFPQKFIIFILLVFFSSVFLFPAAPVRAFDGIGVIDDTDKYAWGEKVGWLNFKATNGNVEIIDTYLSGYVWSQNYGWLNLKPDTGYGGIVNNNGELSGKAWGENLGWIDFKPSNGGVYIDDNGYFYGKAWGEHTGWISFNCSLENTCSQSDFKVRTSWRPTRAPATGGPPPSAYGAPSPPPAPAPGFSVLINNGAASTTDRLVTLALAGGPDARKILVSNFADFFPVNAFDYQEKISWLLLSLTCEVPCQQEQTVYVKFLTYFGKESPLVSDSIILKTAVPAVEVIPPEVLPPVAVGPPAAVPPVTVAPPIAPPAVAVRPREAPELAEGRPELIVIRPSKEFIQLPPITVIPPALALEPPLRAPLATRLLEFLRVPGPLPVVARLFTPKAAEPAIKAPAIARLLEFLAPGLLKPTVPVAPEAELRLLPLLARLPEFLRVKLMPPAMPTSPMPETIPKIAPLVLKGQWELMPQQPVKEFVLAPLPQAVRELAANLSSFGKIIKEVGISKISDLQKLAEAKLTVPTLTALSGIPEFYKLGIKYQPLEAAVTEKIPAEIVFIKSLGGIDIPSLLVDLELGQPKQKIEITASQVLTFIIRPSFPARRVTGQLIFRSRQVSAGDQGAPAESVPIREKEPAKVGVIFGGETAKNNNKKSANLMTDFSEFRYDTVRSGLTPVFNIANLQNLSSVATENKNNLVKSNEVVASPVFGKAILADNRYHHSTPENLVKSSLVNNLNLLLFGMDKENNQPEGQNYQASDNVNNSIIHNLIPLTVNNQKISDNHKYPQNSISDNEIVQIHDFSGFKMIMPMVREAPAKIDPKTKLTNVALPAAPGRKNPTTAEATISLAKSLKNSEIALSWSSFNFSRQRDGGGGIGEIGEEMADSNINIFNYPHLYYNSITGLMSNFFTNLLAIKPAAAQAVQTDFLVRRSSDGLRSEGGSRVSGNLAPTFAKATVLDGELGRTAGRKASLNSDVIQRTEIKRPVLPQTTLGLGYPAPNVVPGKVGEKIAAPFTPYTPSTLATSLEQLTGLSWEELIKLSPKEILSLGLPSELLRLVLTEFEYQDADGDGVWTANVSVPVADGSYEVITKLAYQDEKLGEREVPVVMVVDPEGYVYEKISGDKEVRIPGAIVSMHQLNPETKKYELWQAAEFLQENPQVTDQTGRYSFLVPEGLYYLIVEAPGYLTYQAKPFSVKVGGGVHSNIELKPEYWWLRWFSWERGILLLLVLFLAFNFYRDRRRKIKEIRQNRPPTNPAVGLEV